MTTDQTPVQAAAAAFETAWNDGVSDVAEHGNEGMTEDEFIEKCMTAAFDAATQDVEGLARVIDPAIYPDVNHLTGDGWAAARRAAQAVRDYLTGGES